MMTMKLPTRVAVEISPVVVNAHPLHVRMIKEISEVYGKSLPPAPKNTESPSHAPPPKMAVKMEATQHPHQVPDVAKPNAAENFEDWLKYKEDLRNYLHAKKHNARPRVSSKDSANL